MICKKCGKEFLEDWRKDKDARKTPCLFCCRSCSNLRTHSDETKKKISSSLTRADRYCKACGVLIPKRNKKGVCSKCSHTTKEYKEKISKIVTARVASIDERNRLGEIGKKGGFGKKGYTKKGTYFQSALEEKCFCFLEDSNIVFDPHRRIPGSSKISDIYLNDFDIWIELDGMNRDRIKKYPLFKKAYEEWINKMKLYEERKLNLYIIKKYEDFIDIICQVGSAATAPALHAGITTGSSPVPGKNFC